MSKVFLVNVDRCNGCHACQVVCKDEHCQQAWPGYTAEQPLVGQFWCKIDYRERGQVPWVRVSHIPVLCNHCADAPCIAHAAAAGKPEAVYQRDDGLVIIDPELARGISGLAKSCPVGAIYYNAELDLAQKCSGCAHLLDNGWSVPRCVDACPTEALLYVEESEADLSSTTQAPELAGKGSRLYYKNFPKRFVAGTIVDMEHNNVVIDARAVLKDAAGNVVAEQMTDEFGDFKFNQIEAARYTIEITVPGFDKLVISADVTEQDLSVGDNDISHLLVDLETAKAAAEAADKAAAEAAAAARAVSEKLREEAAARHEHVAKVSKTSLICPKCGKKMVAEKIEDVTRCQFCKEDFTVYTLEQLGATGGDLLAGNAAAAAAPSVSAPKLEL
ncbi:MAG: hypothetical protein LBR39_05895 [Coriobacteriales bacterium]|jgi:Fe-S-cluster-containing dehydrogenase component/ribosomal protein L37AE/L43A|nr:hypothetical protein [Coriobacteriales bacterium]